MTLQIAKLYRGDCFVGYGIAVNGVLLKNQKSTVINSDGRNTPTVTAVFYLKKEQAEDQIIIDLNEA